MDMEVLENKDKTENKLSRKMLSYTDQWNNIERTCLYIQTFSNNFYNSQHFKWSYIILKILALCIQNLYIQ